MDPELHKTIVGLELELHRPEVRKSAERLRELLHPGFLEFGVSGRRWDHESIIEMLLQDDATDKPEVTATGFETTELADGVVLVTYQSQAGERVAWRSSIWRREPAGWQVFHHQGTKVP